MSRESSSKRLRGKRPWPGVEVVRKLCKTQCVRGVHVMLRVDH